ncbi:short chain dehydrogenase [Streptomyces sp. NPDC020141]|uniref:short chain dehydrogenase n=1 Tax=Streptomyces sp. NPDC020141 TaxID=3365065 RepID=UPI0037A060C3
MDILIVGATGTIGSAVVRALGTSHRVIGASRGGALRADLEDASSLDALFDAVGGLDAVVCCAASGPLTGPDTTDEEMAAGARGKLFGQVALARRAATRLRDHGSITLTGGAVPAGLRGGSLGALINSGLEGYVRHAANELPRGLRINLISPGWVRETLVGLGADPDGGTPAAEVARAYARAVEGAAQGEVFRP